METFLNSNKLTYDEITEFNQLYSLVSNPTISQNYSYSEIFNESKCFFALRENDVLKSYLIVHESELSKIKLIKYAKINSEPIGLSDLDKKKLLIYVIKHYQKLKYSEIDINLFKSNIDLINTNELKSISKESNKRKTATIYIDITKDIEIIYNGFSNNIKKNIKKGTNKGITTNEILSKEDIDNLAEIHVKMSQNKKISHFTKEQIINIFNFITNEKQGFIIGCYLNNSLIGGIACIKQANRIEYFIGITDPDYKKFPITHLAIYNAILISKNKGYNTFDMGGIVLNASINDQLHSITEFKLDFSKNIIPHKPQLILKTNLFYYFLKRVYLNIFNLLYK